jgi:hypothetical protein
MNNKKTVYFFINTSLVLIISIVVFNYETDTFNLYGNHSNNSIINDLNQKYYISSKNITSNRVDNIYDKLLYIKKNEKIDVLVIGSSRVMFFHKEFMFDNSNIEYLNFTDGTASLNHYAKVIGMFNKYSIKLPKTIILGLDPWVFDSHTTISKIKNLINISPNSNDSHYGQLFNFEYTKLNLFSFVEKKSYIKSKSIEQLLNNQNSNMILSPNGDIYYPKAKENIDLKNLKNLIYNNIKTCKKMNYDTKCVDYDVLRNISEFRYFLNYLKDKGCKVIIYLPPFAPTFYNYIVEDNKFKHHYNRIIKILKDEKIKHIIGSYNPNDLNLTDSDFMDSIHPKNLTIEKIFKNIKIDKL